ncbi:MAG: PaaX family transcriptional regulator, phenylacetic acid degradation operon negative regulatory [Candidatus Berkelbacteria bacterium]|nr:PaaX family transcriptional regulator, phenylacetic acid degradation operon negative regulatory [Candidatus Berkelbacteria bacterium]
MRRLKIGINEKEIIEYIGIGFILVAALTSTNFPRVFIPLVKKRGIKWIKKLFKQLEEKRVIYLSGEKVKLTKKGREILDKIYLSKFKIDKTGKWDGLWRLVSYDVPEIYKHSRNTFRRVLENNGFRQIHKSLWVSPFDCKEEVAVFCKNLNMTKNVIVMMTDHLPNQEEMIEHFNLK